MQVAFFILVFEKRREDLLDCPLFSEYYSQLFEVNESRFSNCVYGVFHPFETNMGKFLTEELLAQLSRQHRKLLDDRRLHAPTLLLGQLLETRHD